MQSGGLPALIPLAASILGPHWQLGPFGIVLVFVTSVLPRDRGSSRHGQAGRLDLTSLGLGHVLSCLLLIRVAYWLVPVLLAVVIPRSGLSRTSLCNRRSGGRRRRDRLGTLRAPTKHAENPARLLLLRRRWSRR